MRAGRPCYRTSTPEFKIRNMQMDRAQFDLFPLLFAEVFCRAERLEVHRSKGCALFCRLLTGLSLKCGGLSGNRQCSYVVRQIGNTHDGLLHRAHMLLLAHSHIHPR